MGSLSEASARMRRKGTVGAFTKQAKAVGKGVQEFAKEKAHAGGTLGKRANFARMAGRHFKPLGKGK